MCADLLAQLRQVQLFAALEPDDLRAVAQSMQTEHHPAGAIVASQGQPGSTAYMVQSGELRLLQTDVNGQEVQIGTLGPDAFFGETALLLSDPHNVTIQAASDSTLLALHQEDFERILSERPQLRKALQMRPEVASRTRGVHVKGQDPDEKIILILRKHWARLVSNLALPVFVFIVALAGTPYLAGRLGPAAAWAGGLLTVLALLVAAYLTVDHFNDRYLITSKRVVHDERHLLLRDLRAEAPLRAIQDIQQVRDGLLAHIANIGDLIIETAGERGHVVFRQIPDPSSTQELIFQEVTRLQALARAEERAAIRAALTTRFSDAPSPSTASPEPQPAPVQHGIASAFGPWIRTVQRTVGYFVPPLQAIEGDTITWRKHWVALIRPLALPTALGALATAVAVWLLYSPTAWQRWQLVLLVYGLSLVFIMPWWLWCFEDWKNDIYQVTATRLIDIERLPFYLRETRREASLGMIQNVNLEVPSLVGKLLNYGSVTIETAGAGAFTFDLVRDPRGVQAEIFRRMERFQRRQQQEAAVRRRDELLEWFAAYDQMRGAESALPQPPSPA